MADNTGILLPDTARRPNTSDRHAVALSREIAGAPQSFASDAAKVAFLTDEPNLLVPGMLATVLDSEPNGSLRGAWVLTEGLTWVRQQAALEAKAADLEQRTALLAAAQTAGLQGYPTWSALSPIVGTMEAQAAEVEVSDTGSHVDPVKTGNQVVKNTGRFAWRGGTPSGWERLGDSAIAVSLATQQGLATVGGQVNGIDGRLAAGGADRRRPCRLPGGSARQAPHR